MHGRGPTDTWSVPGDALAGDRLVHRFTVSLPLPAVGPTPGQTTDDGATSADATGRARTSSSRAGTGTTSAARSTGETGRTSATGTTPENGTVTATVQTATGDDRPTRRLWPVALGDRLYVADEAGGVRAIRADDGSEVWVTDTVTPVGPIAVGDGAVYAADPGALVSLDRADGTVRWRYDLGSGFGVPVLASGAVFLTGRERLHAVEVADGTRRWMTPTGDDPGRPAVTGSAVFVASDRGGTVTARDPSDGERLWQQAGDVGYLGHEDFTEYDGTRPPAVRGETVYVPQGHAVVALDPADGGVDWTWESNGNDYLGTLSVTDDRVFYKAFFRPHESLKDTMFALPAGGEEPEWCRSLDGATLRTTPVSGSGRVLAQFGGAREDERLVAFDAATGDVAWTFRGYEGRALSPVVAGGSLYVGTDAGRLYGLTLR